MSKYHIVGNHMSGLKYVFSASKNRKSLNHLKTVIEGPAGVKGAKREMDGKNAEHLYIQVGVGAG